MRILHVDHSPVLGGAERSIVELARAQILSGDEAVVAVGQRGRFSGELERVGVPWRDLRWPDQLVSSSEAAPLTSFLLGAPAVLRAAAGLRRLVRRLRPEVVHAHTRKSQLVATIALAGSGAPLIWHLRDDLPARRVLREFIAIALRRAEHAVALSTWLGESYSSRRALPHSGLIGIVPSSINPGPLAGLATPWLSGRHPPRIGFVGQIAAWKAPHLLVEAAEYMAESDAAFRVIGSVWFPAAELGYGRWLEQRLTGSPARSRIEWIPATEDPAQAFAEIDILVHTSIRPEPFGRVLVEAMIARRPIVALRHGSPVELLDEGTAVFADAHSGVAIARAITSLIKDRRRALDLVECAAARAAEYFPQAVARRMRDEYALLLR